MSNRYFKCPNCGDEKEKTNIVITGHKKYACAFICNNCLQTFHDGFVRIYSDKELNAVVKRCGDLPSPTRKSALRKVV